jgi:hypothetical protein
MTAAESKQSSALVVITKGSQLAGALVAGGVGLVGGPAGALGGAAAGWVAGEALAKLGVEVMSRVTGRGQERAAATVLMIEQDRREHEDRGESPRQDGFFDDRGDLRPEEHELLEAVLLSAANTFEERKLPYLAHLFDGVKFDASLKTADALFLSRIADQLTYRQLQGLAVIASYEQHEMGLVEAKTAHETGSRRPDPAFMREFDDLATRGLVGVESTSLVIRTPNELVGQGVLSNYAYAQTRLTGSGRLLHRLMRLDEIPTSERMSWLNELAGIAPALSV